MSGYSGITTKTVIKGNRSNNGQLPDTRQSITRIRHLVIFTLAVASIIAAVVQYHISKHTHIANEIEILESKIYDRELKLISLKTDLEIINSDIKSVHSDIEINFDDPPLVTKERLDKIRDLKADAREIKSQIHDIERSISDYRDKIGELKRQ